MKEILEATEKKSEEAYHLADVLMGLSERETDDPKRMIHYLLYLICLLNIEMRDLVDLLEEQK